MHLMPKRKWLLSSAMVGWLVSQLALVCPAAAELALDLLPTTSTEGSEIQFDLSASELLEGLSVATNSSRRCSPTQRYHVCADLAEISASEKYGTVSYAIDVEPKAGTVGQPARRFTFLGTPRGNFIDQLADIEFRLSVDGDLDPPAHGHSNVLHLPIHSVSGEPLLVGFPEDPPEKVRIGSQDFIWIKLGNKLDDLSVVALRAKAEAGDESLWKGEVEAELRTKGPILAGEPQLRSVKLTLEPEPLKALGKAFFPHRRLAKDEVADESGLEAAGIHEVISVYVTHRTQSGSERDLEIEVPVQFVPSVPGLLLAVLLGAIVGSAAAAARRRSSVRDWLRAAGLALLAAVVVEAVGLVLVNYDSELRILGITLDPYQLVPAGLVGALSTLR